MKQAVSVTGYLRLIYVNVLFSNWLPCVAALDVNTPYNFDRNERSYTTTNKPLGVNAMTSQKRVHNVCDVITFTPIG